MSRDLEPKGEPLRRAVRWLSDQRQADPEVKIARLVDEAGRRFDLSPLDQDWLWRTFVTGDRDGGGGGGAGGG